MRRTQQQQKKRATAWLVASAECAARATSVERRRRKNRGRDATSVDARKGSVATIASNGCATRRMPSTIAGQAAMMVAATTIRKRSRARESARTRTITTISPRQCPRLPKRQRKAIALSQRRHASDARVASNLREKCEARRTSHARHESRERGQYDGC